MDRKELLQKIKNLDLSNIEKPFPAVGDFHTANAVAFFGYDYCYKRYKEDPVKFKDEIRGVAKIKGLALCYGLGARGLLDVTNNDLNKATELYENFFNNLPEVSSTMRKLVKETSKKFYLTNIFGRRLFVNLWSSKDPRDRARARNNTFNFPIQSMGADISKLVLCKLGQWLEENRLYKDWGNLVTEQHLSRILKFDIERNSEEEVQELEVELEKLENGHTLVLIVKGDEIISQFDRYLQIPMSLITKFKLEIVF